jgi:hypothetical protein
LRALKIKAEFYMGFIAKRTFAHGRVTFKKGSPVTGIEGGYEKKLLEKGLIEPEPKAKAAKTKAKAEK